MTTYTIHWKNSNGGTGNGQPTTDYGSAQITVTTMNLKYPTIKHWIETKDTSTDNLNELLTKAKNLETQFQESGMPSEQVEIVSDSWLTIYHYLASLGQFDVLMNDGVTYEVRAVGMLYDDHKIVFSSHEDPSFFFSGINLMSIKSIHKI